VPARLIVIVGLQHLETEMKQPPELQAFIQATENLCGEANEAARLSTAIFSEPELREIRRALARCMEIVDGEVYRVVRSKYPGALPSPE
jgi:hypothetical protein